MKKLIIVVLAIFSFQVGFSQEIDQVNLTKILVKLRSAENLYKEGKYSDVLSKIREIEEISGGMESAKIQNLKVKAYVGRELFSSAERELNKLYNMNPDNDIIEDIASYESKIDEGIKFEIAKKKFDIFKKREVELNNLSGLSHCPNHSNCDFYPRIQSFHINGEIFPTIFLIHEREGYSRIMEAVSPNDVEKMNLIKIDGKYQINLDASKYRIKEGHGEPIDNNYLNFSMMFSSKSNAQIIFKAFKKCLELLNPNVIYEDKT